MTDLTKLSDADLLALRSGDLSKVSDDGLRMMAAQAAPEKQPAPEVPFEDPGFGQTLLIGAGRTFDRIGKGAQQMYYGATGDKKALADLKARAESDDAAYAPLRKARPFATGIGESLPSLALPGGGAATLWGNVARMGAAGAIPGMLEYGSIDDRLTRGATGFAAGASIPVLGAAWKTGKAFAEPLYKSGRDQVIGRVLNQVGGDDAAAIASRLRSAAPLVPGSMPTAAQVAESGGIAALERAAAQANPQAYATRAMEQASARLNALRGIAGDESQRAAQEALVQKTARKLYGKAFGESVDVTPDMVRLASRPSMRAAEKRAVGLASELSSPFKSTLDNLRPKYVAATARPMEARVIERAPNELLPIQTPERWVTAPRVEPDPAMRGLGVTRKVEDLLFAGRAPQRYVEVPGKISERTIPAGKMAQDMIEIPPLDSVPVRDMHTLKMGMDALLGDRTLGIAGREADAIRATRERLIGMMPEPYQTARQAHIELNKPIHQMDIASELINKVSPALSDFGALAQESGAKYAQALRGGDVMAKNVTGLKNATMRDIMTPQQMRTLNAIGEDLARKANAQNLGRGVGSDTFQKLSMNNIAQQSGMPRLAGGLLEFPGISRATRWIYQGADEKAQGLLSDALLDPKQAADLMQKVSEQGLLKGSPKTRKVIEQSLLRSGLLGVPYVGATVE